MGWELNQPRFMGSCSPEAFGKTGRGDTICFHHPCFVYCLRRSAPHCSAWNHRGGEANPEEKTEAAMRFLLGVIFGGLVIIFMIQNVDPVNIKFLLWSITIPRAIMVLVVFVVGIFLGWVVKSIGNIQKRKRAGVDEQWREA